MPKSGKKFIIGLTGNIASGKSVIRKMLEHLGAYGIDSDDLSHRVIEKNGPGFQKVVDSFGSWVLSPDGQIDRSKLGKIVFNDPVALKKLEDIIHPYVTKAVNFLISRSNAEIIVIEAVKIIESPLKGLCDVVWVTTCIEEIRIARLVQKRGMDVASARERIDAQGSDTEKIKAANLIIDNSKSFDETWKQVKQGWDNLKTPKPVEETVTISSDETETIADLYILRANPKHAEQIAFFINRMNPGSNKYTRMDIMAAFGEKAYLLLMSADKIVGLVGWQVENLVSCTDDVNLVPNLQVGDSLSMLVAEMENKASELQAEASLIFVNNSLARQTPIWSGLGYEKRLPESLTVSAWREAAATSGSDNNQMFFKQLKENRILRPI
ncbi:MAG: dephospho-CoA kinase [Anaerolineales bacterium]|nr:dephospho-CoA kinase [Anaerolineales bacterium]